MQEPPLRPALTVRPDLAATEPYFSPQRRARYRMNTNECPYPPPPEVVGEVAAAVRSLGLNRYPDRDASALVQALAAFCAWPEEGTAVANGSNEVLMQLFLAFGGPGRAALVFEPTYSLHTLIPRISGTRVVQDRRAETFEVDPERAVEAIRRERPEIVVLCSPNNPTGGCESLPAIAAIADKAPGIVVVDEAYAEFAPAEESARAMLADRPNLVLTKTFSKAWRLAGARIGYLLAAPALVAQLDHVRLPYHLPALTQAVGVAALRHADKTLETVKLVIEERDRISMELQAMGVKSYPSRANFVLFEVDDPDKIWGGLLDRGILIRNYSGMPGLEACLRVTAGLPEETDAFLEAMTEVVDG